MKSNHSIAVLTSSGPDSLALLHWAEQRYRHIYPLYVRQGYRWEDVELFWLKKILKKFPHGRKLKPLSILHAPIDDVFKNHWSVNGKRVPGFNSSPPSVYLPGRNLFLLSKGAAYCKKAKIEGLAVGTLKGNPFVDGKRKFFKTFEVVSRSALDHSLKIKSPFIGWTKPKVLRYGKKLPMNVTFSCLDPQKRKHCGNCNKCAERAKSFASLGILNLNDYVEKKFVRKLIDFS